MQIDEGTEGTEDLMKSKADIRKQDLLVLLSNLDDLESTSKLENTTHLIFDPRLRLRPKLKPIPSAAGGVV
jgi:hypothetical protein